MSSIIDHLSAASRLLRAARADGMAGLSGGELAEVMRLAQDAGRLVQAITLDATAEADRLHVARREGAASTSSWIAQTAGISSRDAARDLKLARDLQTAAPQTREAMDLPGMSAPKARIIARAMTDLPREVDDDDRRTVEADLVAKAQKHSVDDLRRAARRSVEVLDRQWADRQEARALDDEENRADRASEFWMRPADADGMVEGGFLLPVLEADILRSALESKTSPRHDRLHDTGPGYRHRLGRAFTDIVRHLPTDCFGNHGGVAATLVVTIDHRSLVGQIEAAGTDSHATRIAPDTVRRLACDANLLPAVLDGDSQILDWGRQKRLFTPAQRLALAHRDAGCAFPGCDRPPGWTEAHHMNPWSSGGTTNLADGVLLCAHHHRVIHHGDWQVRPGPDGRPEFIPPPHVDARGRPRTNDRWRPHAATMW